METNPNNRSWFYYYSHLIFNIKFIVSVFLIVLLVSFFILSWGKSESDNRRTLEKIAHERHAGLEKTGDFNQQPIRKAKKLRTLAPDLNLAVSQCPHPFDGNPALLNSIRLANDDSVCKKALFAAACQLEKALLYPANLPVTCDKEAKPVERFVETPRILFVIDVNSAGARQVERLLIHIYQTTHYYLLLMPNCFTEATRRLKRVETTASNIRFLQYSIECPLHAAADASLDETPNSWSFILKNVSDWNWNYLLSLDSFDFPILNVVKLTKFLENHGDTNFLESYSVSETSNYITNISVAVCADGGRRWPIGKGVPPGGPSYYLGPPWYLLTRKFLEYALFSQDDDLVNGLRKFASITPFSAQLLFHTLAHNGRFCNTFVNESLRLTKYHIFDQRAQEVGADQLTPEEQDQLASWTFAPRDFTYLSHWRNGDLHKRNRTGFINQKFFARRFDPTVSQQIIQDVESTLYEDALFPFQTPRLHAYWQILWSDKMKDQRKSTLRYAAVARLLGDLCMKRLKRCRVNTGSISNPILTELSLYRNFDLNDGLILSMNISCSENPAANTIPLQCYVNFMHREKVKPTVTDITDLRNELLHMRVGSDYDHMDNTFRNYAGSVIVEKGERFGLRTQWVQGEIGATYQLAWLDPHEYVDSSGFLNAGPWTTVHFQPKLDDPRTPLEHGIWTAAMLNEGAVVAATEFLVLPESASAYGRKRMQERWRWARRFYEVNRLCVPTAFARTFTKKCKCAPPPVPSCESTSWSTLAADIKSDFASFLRRNKH